MAFRIKYKKLFEVELRQNYYLNSGTTEFAEPLNEAEQAKLNTYRKTYSWLDDFAFFATPETRRLMAGLGMLCKTTSTGFFVAIEVEDASAGKFTPKRVFEAPLRLRFVFRLKAPAFMNYTNLSLAGNTGKIYYFSNRPSEANRSGIEGNQRMPPFLSLEPPAHQDETAYQAGNLIRREETEDIIYLPKRNGEHAAPPENPPDTSVWIRLAGSGYVNRNDRIALHLPVLNFTFAPEPVSTASFTLVDLEAQSFFYAIDAEGQPFFANGPAGRKVFADPSGAPLQQVQLNLRALAPGRYRLSVEGLDTEDNPYTETREIYLDPVMPTQNLFGLVEIFHLVEDELADYRLLDEANELAEPFYFIHFLNRYTFWRYRFTKVPKQVPLSDDFDKVDDLQYVTKASIPLTKSFIKLVDDEGDPLPNPTGGLVKPEEDRVFSEVYVHNPYHDP